MTTKYLPDTTARLSESPADFDLPKLLPLVRGRAINLGADATNLADVEDSAQAALVYLLEQGIDPTSKQAVLTAARMHQKRTAIKYRQAAIAERYAEQALAATLFVSLASIGIARLPEYVARLVPVLREAIGDQLAGLGQVAASKLRGCSQKTVSNRRTLAVEKLSAMYLAEDCSN